MKNTKSIFIAAILLLVFTTVMSSAFIVRETEQVIITQFGKPVGDPIVDPGIHFKIPGIQQANFFDRRFLEWDGSPNQIPTKDKRFIWVDTYARWRITDPLLFFQRVRDERGAQSRLDDILDGETRNAIAKHYLVESWPSPFGGKVEKSVSFGRCEAELFVELNVWRERQRLMMLIMSIQS